HSRPRFSPGDRGRRARRHPDSPEEAAVAGRVTALPLKQLVHLGYGEHLRAVLLGLVELRLAGLVAGDEVRRALLHAVVDRRAGRAEIGVDVLALSREHARHAERGADEWARRGGLLHRLRAADAELDELRHDAPLNRVREELGDALDHLRSE